MNPLDAKLIAGGLLVAGISGPGIYLTIHILYPKTIEKLLIKNKLKIINDDDDSSKWREKLGNGTEENLKKFVKQHKSNIRETISEEDLKETCKSSLNKTENEIDYNEFKQYCSTDG